MRGRLLSTAAAGVCLTWFAPAAWADSYSASASPTTAGTTSQPAPETVHTDLQISTDATGTPRDAVESYASLMPAEYTDMTSKFGTCPRSTVTANADGANHPPPNCPKESVLATGQLESVIPSLKVNASSDQLYVYNNGGDQVIAWFHVSQPTYFTGTVNGVISQGSSPFGPVVTWDFSPAANGQIDGVEIYVKGFQTAWTPQDSASTSGGSSGSSSTKPTTQRNRRAACIKTAKRRYPKGSKRRRAAIRRCNRRYGVKHRSVRRAAVVASASQIAPFESTGCSSGQWKFEAHIKFKNSPDETLDQSANCAPAGGTVTGGGSGGGGGGGGCGLPICPPLPAAATDLLRVSSLGW